MAIIKKSNTFKISEDDINFRVVMEDYVEFSGEQEKDVMAKIEDGIELRFRKSFKEHAKNV